MATIITTEAGLQNMANNLTADYELGNDITCTGSFTPVGDFDGDIGFTGSLDGKGYSIINLTISLSGTDGVGLFSLADGATISNLTLTSVAIVGDVSAGALVGLARNTTTITNCHSSGAISALRVAGGLVGRADYDTSPVIFDSCTTSVNVTTTGATSTVGRCGGFVGQMDKDCTATDCSATGIVIGTSVQVGGFVGHSIGAFGARAIYTRCYSSGSVTTGEDDGGDSRCGGFAGNIAHSLFTDCYAFGDVTGTGQYVGGFVAFSQTSDVFTHCYSKGAISGGSDVGGFAGYGSSTYTNCFWDTQTSGQGSSAGGTGKTTAQMKTTGTFTNAGWNFSTVWSREIGVNSGYPFLQGSIYDLIMTAGNFAVVEERAHYMSTTGIERYNLGIEIGVTTLAKGNVAAVEERFQYVGATSQKERYILGIEIGNTTMPNGNIGVVEERFHYAAAGKERYWLGTPV